MNIAGICRECAGPASKAATRCRKCYEASRPRRLRELTCPDCQTTRLVNHQTYWAAMRRDPPGRCHPCAASVRRRAVLAIGKKACSRCALVKPLTAYDRRTTTSLGYAPHCKACQREITRAYHEAHREQHSAYAKAWNRARPLKRRSIIVNYNASLRGAEGTVDCEAIIARDGMVCHICSEAISLADLSFDHVIPLARGGTHSDDNVRPAHKVCNSRKGASWS